MWAACVSDVHIFRYSFTIHISKSMSNCFNVTWVYQRPQVIQKSTGCVCVSTLFCLDPIHQTLCAVGLFYICVWWVWVCCEWRVNIEITIRYIRVIESTNERNQLLCNKWYVQIVQPVLLFSIYKHAQSNFLCVFFSIRTHSRKKMTNASRVRRRNM